PTLVHDVAQDRYLAQAAREALLQLLREPRDRERVLVGGRQQDAAFERTPVEVLRQVIGGMQEVLEQRCAVPAAPPDGSRRGGDGEPGDARTAERTDHPERSDAGAEDESRWDSGGVATARNGRRLGDTG